MAVIQFEGDYQGYRDAVAGVLASLPVPSRRAYALAVCEHLYAVIDALAPAVAVTEALRSAIDDAWQQLEDDRGHLTLDIPAIERLMPTDESGVGLGGPGLDELSALGVCLALLTESVDGDPASLSRVGSTVVSALGDYGTVDEAAARLQDALLHRLQAGPEVSVQALKATAQIQGEEISGQILAFLST